MTAKQAFTGVDYIRLTALDHSPVTAWELLLAPEFAAEDAAGRKRHMRSVLGYWGRVGEHCFLGESDQGTMLQLSSHVAHDLWKRAGNHSKRCTRLDLQVTYPVHPEPGEYIRTMYDMGRSAPKREGHPPALTLTDTPEGAKMLTVGSRQSLLYGRMYDKGRESGIPEYAGCVRWEIECKAEQATNLNTWLRDSEDEQFQVRSIVHEFWHQRGMTPFWDTYEEMKGKPVETRSRTDETKLAWLKTQIRPALTTLAEHGKLELAIRALFGDDLPDETVKLVAELLSIIDRS